MTILMIIFDIFSFLSLIFFSFKNKEFYQNETINADPGDVLGEIFLYIINLLPWYLKKLFMMLLCLGLCILCLSYFIYE
ncbi:hypothetical protein [Bacillus sp. UMB0893]|uniref:hypothetical protein n=1 Tax=Bacillus sp. UMB0893 TaxID=2066053 RepID=UPI000C75C2EE|nr:hypothetical protein [Bacillus sp. UMB0893]PLR66040.1 hypothetical protein CYJ36_20460 [Bacillus sp. UMB0893]